MRVRSRATSHKHDRPTYPGDGRHSFQGLRARMWVVPSGTRIPVDSSTCEVLGLDSRFGVSRPRLLGPRLQLYLSLRHFLSDKSV